MLECRPGIKIFKATTGGKKLCHRTPVVALNKLVSMNVNFNVLFNAVHLYQKSVPIKHKTATSNLKSCHVNQQSNQIKNHSYWKTVFHKLHGSFSLHSAAE